MRGEDRYWASYEPDAFASELGDKIKNFYTQLRRSDRGSLMRRSRRMYEGFDPESERSNAFAVTFGGEQGELSLMRCNYYGFYGKRLKVLVLSEQMTLQSTPVNGSSQALDQANLFDDILTHYQKSELGTCAAAAVEAGIVDSEGWLLITWDRQEGEPFSVMPILDSDGDPVPEIQRAGKLKIRAFKACDVIRDYTVRGGLDKHRWLCFRDRVNMWDLKAKYPDKAPLISQNADTVKIADDFLTIEQRESEDDVTVYEFFHRRTPSMPDGRYALICNGKVIIDDDLNYRAFPAVPYVPQKEGDGAFGIGPLWDIMGSQEAFDSVVSTALSNHENSGLQLYWSQSGEVEVEDLEGFTLVRSAVKPEPLQLTATSEHSYRMKDFYESDMMKRSGFNPTSLGEATANVRNTSHAALLYSSAIEYNSALKKTYHDMMEQAGNVILSHLKEHATIEQVVEVAGEKKRNVIRRFKSDDLKLVHRVRVEAVGAIQSTVAGKLDMAEKLIQLSNVSGTTPITPHQYMSIVATGRAEFVDAKASQQALIERENELLRKGVPVKPLVTDQHAEHIIGHIDDWNDPDHRLDDNTPEAKARAEHIQWHHDMWVDLTMNQPAILAATGQQPAPLPPAMAGAAMGGTPPNPPGMVGMAAPAPTPPVPNMPPMPEAAVQMGVQQPAPPIDPATGEPIPE